MPFHLWVPLRKHVWPWELWVVFCCIYIFTWGKKYCSCVKLVFKAKTKASFCTLSTIARHRTNFEELSGKPVRDCGGVLMKNDPPVLKMQKCTLKKALAGVWPSCIPNSVQLMSAGSVRTRQCCVRAWLQLCNCILCFFCSCVELVWVSNKCFLCLRTPACFSNA